MSENKIPYSTRNYAEFRDEFMKLTRKYYPDIVKDFSDASIGQWFIELLASVSDDLSYHIDRTFQETDLNSAQEASSLLALARSNGLKVPGKKGALCEIELSCNLPLNAQGSVGTGDLRLADESYAPVIKKGSLFSTGTVTFELMNDVDFREQFDENGISNRRIVPLRDSNGNIVSYTYYKLAVVCAGQSKIMKKVINESDIKPFMEVLVQDSNIMGIESVIVKQGTNLNTDPVISEFTVDEETYLDKYGKPVERFFEVDSLIDQYRYGYELENADISSSDILNGKYYNPLWEEHEYMDEEGNTVTYRRIAKGKWKRLKNKFITEYTDNWQLKLIFGAGIKNQYGEIPNDAQNFTQYMMSRMEANDYMGVLPESGRTMYILYRVGGGEESNIAKGTLTNIVYINYSICGNPQDEQNATKIKNVQGSIAVTNTTPSYGGKDEPTVEELRYLIKYNNSSQNRCVTINDYYSKIMQIPAKYGCPFRIGIIEENNKISIYTLGLNYNGKLMKELAETVADNIKTYLSKYKIINDFVEIKSGKIINIKFEIDVFVDKAYDKGEVVKRIIELVRDYMDIRRHQMGEDIFLGDLQKEIGKLDGVSNVIEIRAYNPIDKGYSCDGITQQLVDVANCCYEGYEEAGENFDRQIDLKASDMILFSETNTMFEILNDNDITVKVKQR
jgi:hypothetical protein